ncbi:MAG: dihydrofolate reductase [Methylococcales bacterium]|nr:dihydrofolate reductase [Methylococcales bacterium]
MKISLIVAMASNRVIGNNGQMPWHLSADLKKFRQITTGFPIIMGRKTYDAIGRPLPNRTNIIVSTNTDYQADGCVVFNDINSALAHAESLAEQVFIIGGATLYAALLAAADMLYITEIHQDFTGDTYFPSFDMNEWAEVAREYIDDDPSVDFSYSFLQFARQTDEKTVKMYGQTIIL